MLEMVLFSKLNGFVSLALSYCQMSTPYAKIRSSVDNLLLSWRII